MSDERVLPPPWKGWTPPGASRPDSVPKERVPKGFLRLAELADGGDRMNANFYHTFIPGRDGKARFVHTWEDMRRATDKAKFARLATLERLILAGRLDEEDTQRPRTIL